MRHRFAWIGLVLLGGIVLAATAFAPKATNAETPAPIQRTLDVTGQGKLTIKYDTAQITLGVSDLVETATGAYQSMGKKMDTVAKALMETGVKEDDIKTGYISLNAEYDWNKEGGQTLRGYRANNTITITTQKLDTVADLIQIAVDAGANTMQGVQFTVKDTDALLNQALDLAVADAKAKGERVAKALGTEIAGVYRISVQDNGRGPVMYDRGGYMTETASAMKAAPAAPVFSGTGEYTASVSVTFEIK